MRRVLTGIAAFLALVVAPSVYAATVGVGTMAQGTVSFSTGSVLAKVMKEKMGMNARVQPNSGETVLVPLINNGELDFGIANVLEAEDAYHGQHGFEGRAQKNLRIAAVLYPLRTALFVRKDSEFMKTSDLKGKRVTYGFSAMGTINTVMQSLLANSGLTEEDIKPVLVPNVVKGAEQFLNGRADAFFFAVGAAKVSEVNASIPLRALPMEDSPEAVKRFNDIFPGGYLFEVPPLPNFAGVLKPTKVLAYDNILLTGTHVSNEMAKAVAEGLAKYKDDLAAGFPLFRGLDPNRIYLEGTRVPFHPGTEEWAKSR
ncbi:MAG: TAXI family TRAP transporter solute-binding subunit [Deferrisomatales bacterium]|nr:TAXI family TRAP transporter solute-binding subunit [Deferrisomatales bacterium]